MPNMNIPEISQWFLHRPRTVKRAITLAVDFIAVILALWLSFSLRYSTLYSPGIEQLWIFLLAPVVAIPVFIKFGLYRAIVRYLGMRAIWTVVKAASLYTLIYAVIILFSGAELTGVVPRTVYGINILILLVFVGGSRLVARWWFSQVNIGLEGQVSSGHYAAPVLIYGAGESGAQLAAALRMARQLRPVAFIDDDSSLARQQINGLNVYPFHKLSYLIEKYEVAELLLAMPSVTRSRRNDIIRLLEPFPLHVRTLPSLSDIAKGKVRVTDVQEVDIADLLGREQVQPIGRLLQANITGKVVMVTGAGGSIGSELCRQIIKLKPTTLILFELNEFGLYGIEQELNRIADESIAIYALLGSVQNQQRVEAVCQKFSVNTIYHAAAYKHVPLMEDNPYEAINTNVFGTQNIANLSVKFKVNKFVFVSTDKAVNPSNIMGASKRIAEIYVQSLDAKLQLESDSHTRFVTTRFGNVLGSNGSVIPLFKKQIENGGPVTVTHPEITRYFMTIPEACQLVLEAGVMGKGGEIYVFDMGESVKIVDLARKMIKLSGYILNKDIRIKFTGLRPGEKLKEELLNDKENTIGTHNPKIMIARVPNYNYLEVNTLISNLYRDKDNLKNSTLVKTMKKIVPEYISNNSIYEKLDGKFTE